MKSLDELADDVRGALAAVDLEDDWVRAEGITVSATGTGSAPGNMGGRRRTSMRSATRPKATGS